MTLMMMQKGWQKSLAQSPPLSSSTLEAAPHHLKGQNIQDPIELNCKDGQSSYFTTCIDTVIPNYVLFVCIPLTLVGSKLYVASAFSFLTLFNRIQ